MNTLNSGVAREIKPGRLAGFEDAADLDLSPALSLPPRPPRAAANVPATATTPATPSQRSQQRRPRAQPSADGLNGASTDRNPTSAVNGAPREGKGPEDRVRPSNVHIPVALLDPLEAKCKENGLSHGEVIIVAIENAHPRLNTLVHPAATAGGNIFASRRSRASRSSDGPLTPLNYRLREADFETLDRLVEEFGASSRGHLITAALNDYFGDQ